MFERLPRGFKIAWLVGLILELGILVFVIWVIIRLLLHFGIL